MLILLHNKFNIITIMRFQPFLGLYPDRMVRFDPPSFGAAGCNCNDPPTHPRHTPHPFTFPEK